MRPDIYDGELVDAMKAENADLRRRLAEVVRENARLETALHRAMEERKVER